MAAWRGLSIGTTRVQEPSRGAVGEAEVQTIVSGEGPPRRRLVFHNDALVQTEDDSDMLLEAFSNGGKVRLRCNHPAAP